MTKTIKSLSLLVLCCVGLFGQTNTLVQTTTSAAMTDRQTFVVLTSATGVNAAATGVVASQLYIIDKGQTMGELVSVTSVSSTTIQIRRAMGGIASAHASGAIVYVATSPNWFYSKNPSGSCTAASTFVTPWLNTSLGTRFTCDAATGTWVESGDRVFFVPPTQCTTAPTTSTVTNTYPQIGASTIFVLNAVTNAAAGTTTLVCNIQVPSAVTTLRGAFLKDIVVAVGSQVTAPTSIGTATLGTVTFPTPVATTQTASTVTPVTAGALTQLGPTTTVLTVTTAGAFLTFKYTPASPVSLDTDLQALQFTVPYLQSAAAAMTLNWPGLWVHYIAPLK